MVNDYESIDTLESKQNQLLDESLNKQQDIINQQTQMNIDNLERQKQEVDKDATKTNRALYTQYRKANNPFGANAEVLASKGLGNSGYAESSQTNLYNTYQKNVTDTINNARSLKSDFDFQMSQARQNGNIAMAQNALEIYNQKLQLLTQNYELRNNREQFLYQQQRDKISDNQWNQTFDYNKQRDSVNDNQWQQTFDYQQQRDLVSDDQWKQSFGYQQQRDQISDNQWQQNFDYQKEQNAIANNQWEQEYAYQQSRDKVADNQWQKTYDYQKERDKVSDSQWEKEYQLSKKAKASSSSSRSSKSSSSGTTSGYVISNDDVAVSKDNNTSETQSTNSSINVEELASRVSGIIAMAQKDLDPNKTSAKNLINTMYQKGQLTAEEKAIVLQMIGG